MCIRDRCVTNEGMSSNMESTRTICNSPSRVSRSSKLKSSSRVGASLSLIHILDFVQRLHLTFSIGQVDLRLSGEHYRNDLGAVSYTHLDVYKRQVSNGVSPCVSSATYSTDGESAGYNASYRQRRLPDIHKVYVYFDTFIFGSVFYGIR